MITKLQVEKTLAECIEHSLSKESKDTHDFQWDSFFRMWFRERGIPYFFLFKRHLGVTNTQYVELFSLLHLHSTAAESRPGNSHLLFHTTEQVKSTVVDAINMLLDAPSADRTLQAQRFASTYVDVFASTVAVNMFYCSCAVFFPPGVEADLVQICADSGYIHSLGRSIYVRNIKKSRENDFDLSITRYLEPLQSTELPIPFVVYAHEDFSGYDKSAKEQISRGIEHTKLYVEKMTMGGYRLSQVVHDMRSKYIGKLDIPEPGPYDTVHTFKGPRTLWLISDRSVSATNPTNPGSDRYYICYEQTAKSESPFFLFDENKPAWKSHTTLPHSLTAALLNSARPIPPGGAVCDPFGGTGTTWFESKRLALNAIVRCTDLSDAAQLLASDNLRFFLMKSEDLQELCRAMREISDAVKADKKGGLDTDRRQASFEFLPETQDLKGAGPYLYAVSLLNDLRHNQPHEDQEFELSAAFVKHLGTLALITRYIFYVVLRAELRYQGGYKRKSVTFDKAFCDSLDDLIGQIQQFTDLKSSVPYTAITDSEKSYIAVASTYSQAIIPAFVFRSIASLQTMLTSEVFNSDARTLPEGAYDVVICDPPYGFNTTEDQAALANLYSEFLRAALLSLREGGHLILCVPEVSYTGRDLPYCTRADLITNQVLTKAESLGKYIFVPAKSVPSRVFSPPYYWESERALRRVILHFRVSTIPEHRR